MYDLSSIFALTIFALLFIKSLDFIYLFQIKEYRFDRLISKINEEGIFSVFYFRKIQLPARKLRNYLLVLFTFISTVSTFLLLYDKNFIIILLYFLFLPMMAFIGVSFGVVLTGILVKVYRDRLIQKAQDLVNKSRATFIGITGSYGKTSTKEFLFHILSLKYKVAKTEGNMNSDIGIALSILKNLKKNTQYFIVEVGAYKKGEIKKACEIFRPKYAILTGIGNQHLDLFGSKQNLISAKLELLRSLPPEGKAYINQEIEGVKLMLRNLSCQINLYSTQRTLVNYDDKPFDIKINLLGRHNIANLLPCVAVAFDLGLNQKEIITALAKIRPIANKLSSISGINSSTIIQDSENSNIEGFIAAIQSIRNLSQPKKIIISRGIIELGTEKEKSYRKILNELNQSDLILYTTDKLFKTLDTKSKVIDFNDEQTLLKALMKELDKHTLLIIEGKFTDKFIGKIQS